MNLTSQRLHGWKEIASHFSRSVRCVQRWERQEDLPVHRHTHARGNTLYAFLEELDAWQKVERKVKTKLAAPHGKQKILNMRNLPAGRKIRRSQTRLVNESFSEERAAWSAADVQNIAYQLALRFLRAAENKHFGFASDALGAAVSATSRTRNRSA